MVSICRDSTPDDDDVLDIALNLVSHHNSIGITIMSDLRRQMVCVPKF
jgi:hypothetical protein